VCYTRVYYLDTDVQKNKEQRTDPLFSHVAARGTETNVTWTSVFKYQTRLTHPRIFALTVVLLSTAVAPYSDWLVD
jgi:hypothetical protein